MVRTKKRLGELLLDAKKISEKDLLRALTEQKKYGDKLGKTVVKLGLLSEREIIDTVSGQLSIPIININELTIPEDVVRLISPEMAKNSLIIPVSRRHNVLKLAMVDPLDINAMDNVARAVQMEIEPLIVTEGDLKQALVKSFSCLVGNGAYKFKRGLDKFDLLSVHFFSFWLADIWSA